MREERGRAIYLHWKRICVWDMALLEAMFPTSVVSVNCCLVKELRIYIQPSLFFQSRLVMNLKTPQPLLKPARNPHNHFYAVWNRNALAGVGWVGWEGGRFAKGALYSCKHVWGRTSKRVFPPLVHLRNWSLVAWRRLMYRSCNTDSSITGHIAAMNWDQNVKVKCEHEILTCVSLSDDVKLCLHQML
jgi:hypothetical protein